MEASQIEALDEHSDALVAALRPSINCNALVRRLVQKKVITRDAQQEINNVPLDADRIMKLFEILETRETAWDVLLSFLKENFKGLAKKLEDSAGGKGNVTATNGAAAAVAATVGHVTQREMDKQKAVLDRHMEELTESIVPEILVTHLALKHLISRAEEARINGNLVYNDKNRAIFQTMAPKDGWWDTLIDFLRKNKIGIVNRLVAEYESQ